MTTSKQISTLCVLGALALTALACGAGEQPEAETAAAALETAAPTPDDLPRGLLLSLAVLEKDPQNKPLPQPARVDVLVRQGGEWRYSSFEDPTSNVFHKAMIYEPAPGDPALLTLGGTAAALTLWRPDADPEVIWQKDFGGKWSRMRDAEIADFDGDGTPGIAVATHDQGVVAVVEPDGEGGWAVEELDHERDTFVHEIEIGDLNGDGDLEIYATPSEPNKLDGTPQPGKVVRYVPAAGEGRVVVADLGDEHAKEILVEDVDGDGSDELYVSVEAVAGGQVQILRYDADTPADEGALVARIPDTLTRFLTAGDVDGDRDLEMVAAAMKSGLWLLEPGTEPDAAWTVTSIDRDSSGFEHASILTDLDGDGTDELYVASDEDREVRRYVWVDGEPVRDLIHAHEGDASILTWNIMPAPVELLPTGGE